MKIIKKHKTYTYNEYIYCCKELETAIKNYLFAIQKDKVYFANKYNTATELKYCPFCGKKIEEE